MHYGYWVNVPNGYKTTPGTGAIWYWDYAAIDFAAYGGYPGATYGFFPAGYSGASISYARADHLVYGYDVQTPLPPDPQLGYTYWNGVTQLGNDYTQARGASLIGRSCYSSGISIGCAYRDSVDTWRVNTENPIMDMTSGWSGTGMVSTVHEDVGDPTWYTAGVWGHGCAAPSCSTTFNAARILDPAVWDFVGDVTSQW